MSIDFNSNFRFRKILLNRNINTIVILFCALLVAIIWSVLFYTVTNEQEAALKGAVTVNEERVQAFEEHTLRTLKNADQLSLVIKYWFENKRAGSDVCPMIKKAGLGNRPLVLLSVADENGDLIASSQEPFVRSNIKDRAHFAVHMYQDTGKLFVSDPVLGRSSGKWSIQLTRRINKADGSFGGVVVASIDPLYFTEFYQYAYGDTNTTLALIKRNGIVEAWKTGDNSIIGVNLEPEEKAMLDRMLSCKLGHMELQKVASGETMLYCYRSLEEYPLIVLAGITKEKALAEYMMLRKRYFFMALVLTAFIIVSCYGLILMLNSRRDMAQRQIALYKISETANSVKSLDELYCELHLIIKDFIEAENFFITICEEEADNLIFPYRSFAENAIPILGQIESGLAENVIRSGKTVLTRQSDLEDMGIIIDADLAALHEWQCVGVPLKSAGGTVLGVMASLSLKGEPSAAAKDSEFLSFISDQVALAIARKGLEEKLRSWEIQTRNELDLAARFQLGSLPEPMVTPEVRVSRLFVPFKDVSGDLFNYRWFDDSSKLRGYIVDVSGHGVSTALQTATLKMHLDHVFFADEIIEERHFQVLNLRIKRYLSEEAFAAIQFFELDFSTSTLTVISGGIQFFLVAHPPGEGELIPTFSGYLGLFDDDAELAKITRTFKHGDIFCMMSDGVSDLLEMSTYIKQDSFAGYEEYYKRLVRCPDRTDDFSVVCIEILRKGEMQVLNINNGHDIEQAQTFIGDFLGRVAMDSSALLEAAVHEALNNALDSGGQVTVKLRLLGNRIIIRIKDDGQGFDTHSVNEMLSRKMAEADFDNMFDDISLAESGRGILMMKMWCDRVIYNRKGNEVLLMKRILH